MMVFFQSVEVNGVGTVERVAKGLTRSLATVKRVTMGAIVRVSVPAYLRYAFVFHIMLSCGNYLAFVAICDLKLNNRMPYSRLHWQQM